MATASENGKAGTARPSLWTRRCISVGLIFITANLVRTVVETATHYAVADLGFVWAFFHATDSFVDTLAHPSGWQVILEVSVPALIFYGLGLAIRRFGHSRNIVWRWCLTAIASPVAALFAIAIAGRAIDGNSMQQPVVAFLIPLVYAATFFVMPDHTPPAGFCAACGYSLRGIRSINCPECGRTLVRSRG